MPPYTVAMLLLCLGVCGSLHAGLPVKPIMSPGLRHLVLKGHSHYQQQEYDLARTVFQEASDYAVREGNLRYLPRIRSNIGATFLAVQQFQNALPYFLEARVTARAQSDPETDASACVNLAAIYMAIGDGDAAAESLEAAAVLLPASSPNKARLVAQRARLEYRRGGGEAAVARMGEALAEAQSAGDLAVEGLIWDDLAMLRMDAGDLAGAETALSNEYRLWALFHTPNPEHLNLRIAQLRLVQGRAEESLMWLDRAGVHARRSPGSMTPHEWEHDVALALEAAGRRGEALQAARRAWLWSSEWRREALPAQSAQLVADVTQGELAEHYAKLAGNDAEYREDVFLAVERSRAASLRYAILNRPVMRERLGPEYLRTLKESRESTALWINSGDMGQEPQEIGKLRARLTEIETSSGLPPTIDVSGVGLVRRLSGRLGRDAALFSFQMGEPDSNLWILTSHGLLHAKLPGRAELSSQVERFRESIEANEPNTAELGARLYGVLFGSAPRAAIEAQAWYLSLDDALLALPFSALRQAAGPEGRWLVESHRLTVVPSALWLLQPMRPANNRRLLAVGDAVHNSADPRYMQAVREQTNVSLGFGVWFQRAETGKRSQFELPTLAGSGAELDGIAALWRRGGQTADVLSGLKASEADFAEALGRKPGTVHFATHVIPIGREDANLLVRQHTTGDGGGGLRVVARPDDAFMALSIRPGGERDGINTASVPAYDLPGSLVVLNGCSSALGRMQSHAGLMGFARAWLSAGASSVIASLWPLSDDSGTLFESFYKARLSGRSASEALQTAQLEMIRGQGWRAEARHWAAYISAGQE